VDAKYLAEELGQQVFVDNRGGAGGTIGSAYVAKAAPDGYTLKADPLSSAVINGLVYNHLPYDIRRDFTPVSELAETPTVLVVNAGIPARTLRQFIALAGQNPGKFNFGSTGGGSSVQLEAVLFEQKTGVQLVHIPFRGAGPAVTALVGGQTQMQIGAVSTFLPFIRSGKLRALCVNSEHRIALLPDLPTAAEAGLPDFVLPDWYGLFAPRGTPTAIVARLNRAVRKINTNLQLRGGLAAAGLTPVGKTTTEFAAFWRHEFDLWAPIVKASGTKLD
jgi:tripartite-type tricarboxylate transporter receptor subunit TctC